MELLNGRAGGRTEHTDGRSGQKIQYKRAQETMIRCLGGGLARNENL